MRKFVIEDQPKEWLFDLDGNVFHPKLRDEIEKGMVVGVRISERIIHTNERIKIIDNFENYIKLHKQFMDHREEERQKGLIVKDKANEIIHKLNEQLEEQNKEKKNLEIKIVEIKQSKPLDKKEITTTVNKLSEINVQIREIKHHLNKLKNITNTHFPFTYKEYLMDVHNFPEELFKLKFNDEKFYDLEDLFFETATKDRPWSEIIFFKVVKKSGDKLYGDVIERFRRVNSKCPLKEGDRISFYAKSIFLVPTILNKSSKLQQYLQTNYSYKFYKSKKITDWSGVFLDTKARDFVGPGSIVRIQLKEINQQSGQIFYAYILEQEGEYFWGEILDFYIVIEEKIADPIKIGCIFKFSKESITEIPIMWNKHLPELEKLLNKDNWGYAITGYRSDDVYFDLEKLK